MSEARLTSCISLPVEKSGPCVLRPGLLLGLMRAGWMVTTLNSTDWLVLDLHSSTIFAKTRKTREMQLPNHTMHARRAASRLAIFDNRGLARVHTAACWDSCGGLYGGMVAAVIKHFVASCGLLSVRRNDPSCACCDSVSRRVLGSLGPREQRRRVESTKEHAEAVTMM